MSLPPDLTPKKSKPPKRVPLAAVVIPWTVAGTVIASYAVEDPRDLTGAAWALSFPFIGMGCATLCAWLIQRSTVDSHNNFELAIPQIIAIVGRAKFDEGFAAGRASVPSVIVNPRFGMSASTQTGDDTADGAGEELPRRTGTDPAP